MPGCPGRALGPSRLRRCGPTLSPAEPRELPSASIERWFPDEGCGVMLPMVLDIDPRRHQLLELLAIGPHLTNRVPAACGGVRALRPSVDGAVRCPSHANMNRPECGRALRLRRTLPRNIVLGESTHSIGVSQKMCSSPQSKRRAQVLHSSGIEACQPAGLAQSRQGTAFGVSTRWGAAKLGSVKPDICRQACYSA